jgi:diacylglycerol kinase family enzyme
VQELAVIFNPEKITELKLKRSLIKAGLKKPVFFPTDAATHGKGAMAKAIAAGHRKFAVAGGDGTLRVVAEAILESGQPCELGILPIGTGNVLARNLKLPINSLDAAARRVASSSRYPVDIGFARVMKLDGTIAEYYFTGIAGLGLDAKIMQQTSPERKRKIGWFAYVEGGFLSLPLKFEKFDVTVDEQDQRTLKSYSFLVGNAGWLPGQISMMPDATLDDGRLDIAAIGPRGLWNWVDLLSRITWQNKVVRPLALGRKLLDLTQNLKTIENLRGARIRVRPHNPVSMQLDGDPIGEVLEVDFYVLPKALILRV